MGRFRACLGYPQIGAVEAPGLSAGTEASLDPVSSRSGHDVDQATLEVPVFGAGAQSADLDLLDPAGARLEKISAQAGMIHRHPVELVVVGLAGGGAPDLVGPGAGGEGHQVSRFARQRQERQLSRGETASELGFRGADPDRRGQHYQRIQGHRRRLQGHGQGLDPARADHQVVHDDRPEPDPPDRQAVAAWWEEGDPEGAVGGRGCPPLGESVEPDEQQIGLGDRSAGGRDAALQDAGLGVQGCSEEGEEEREEETA